MSPSSVNFGLLRLFFRQKNTSVAFCRHTLCTFPLLDKNNLSYDSINGSYVIFDFEDETVQRKNFLNLLFRERFVLARKRVTDNSSKTCFVY